MKNIKLIFLLLAILFVSPVLQAQSKAKIPEKLQGFWHWEVNKSGDWDGSSISADYVEYLYKIFYVENINEQGANGYHLWLKSEAGEEIELTVTRLNNKNATLQFSRWTEPKNCQLLDSITDTEKVPLNKLPKSIFQEWTNDNKGTFFCKFHDTNKMLFENKEWDILSAGYYQKKEYRLLIRSGNLYKLIYLSNLSNQSLRLACNLKTTQLSLIAANKEIYKILGNWVEKNNNQWGLGFFEQFAIYKGDFWNYKSIDFKGETATIVLTKGTKQAKFTLLLKSDVLCEVTFNGQQSKTYFKCGKNLPAYATPDAISFKDTHFQKTDTVTIKGYLRNNPLNQPFNIIFWNPIKKDQEEYYADLDAFGRFTIKFPLINTTQLLVDWGRITKADVAEPGETYFFFFDCSSRQQLIMGDNERLHNEMAGYEPYNPYQTLSREEIGKRAELAPMTFLPIKKEDLRLSNNHLNNYIANNPNVSERFKYYYKNYYRFMGLDELMQHSIIVNPLKGERFPVEFMKYIKDSLYQNRPPQPFTLVGEFNLFMDYYKEYAIETKVPNISSESLITEILNQQKAGRFKLTDEEKQILTKYSEFEKLSWKLFLEKADSTKRAEALKSYPSDIFKKLGPILEKEEIKKFRDEEWPKLCSQSFYKKRLNAENTVLDSLITDPQLKEFLEVQKFYRLIYDTQTRLPDGIYQQFKEKITSPALAAPIISLQNHYSQLSKQDIFYAESLKKTDHLKESKDADTLFAQLTAPYKGKVIYIDFWGTWCGPCKEQLKYAGAVKEALKNKDVIFMYFANNSPEESWKNVIKENHLSGPNVVHYRLTDQQQGMIERRLSINSFPTFILMDKTGRIVNMRASRPEQKNELVQEITNLLN